MPRVASGENRPGNSEAAHAPAAPIAAVPSGGDCWLATGQIAYRAMLAAIDAAQTSVRLETYIYRADGPGDLFRSALTRAAARGVRVQVLIDAFGSSDLPRSYWKETVASGGRVRLFNPFSARWLTLRNHRKMLLVDDGAAYVGGFNIGPEYDGDGVDHGWRDLGIRLHDPAALQQLGWAFDEMFARHRPGRALMGRVIRRPLRRGRSKARSGPVYLIGPRLGRNRFYSDLVSESRRATDVRIVAAYFVPGLRLRRSLRSAARRGASVELILAGKTDSRLSRFASHLFYGSLLRAGVRIWEYQPQILHTKLAIVDGAAFVGSSNLDTRSVSINYELVVRVSDPRLVAGARELFAADKLHARQITLQAWRKSRNWLTRFSGWLAHFVLAKVDPWLARLHVRSRRR